MQPNHYEQLRAFQVEIQQSVFAIHDTLRRQQEFNQRAESQRRQLHKLIQAAGSTLVELQREQQLHDNRLAELEAHPSNSAGEQFKRLSGNSRAAYLASLGSGLLAAILMVSGGLEVSNDGEGFKVNLEQASGPALAIVTSLVAAQMATTKGEKDEPIE